MENGDYMPVDPRLDQFLGYGYEPYNEYPQANGGDAGMDMDVDMVAPGLMSQHQHDMVSIKAVDEGAGPEAAAPQGRWPTMEASPPQYTPFELKPGRTFAFDVRGNPATSRPAREHHRALCDVFIRHGLRFECFVYADHTLAVEWRRYLLKAEPAEYLDLLPEFSQPFFCTDPNKAVAHAAIFPAKMAVVFETRPFMDGSYPSMVDPTAADDPSRYGDPDLGALHPVVTAGYTNTSSLVLTDGEPTLDLGPTPVDKEDSPPALAPARSKPVAKPDRNPTKNARGYWECEWPNCAEETKEFQRRCEFNKHMDKHERPYRCLAEGCEKLPGFTYAGGQLRHEREVHGKHGGPKNPLHCPHFNCKRHSGKGFSRQENLNEHLRRVHTGEGGAAATGTGDDTDEVASPLAAAAVVATPGTPASSHKRKRDGDEDDLRDVIKRVRMENQELKKRLEDQQMAQLDMMAQIRSLQDALTPRGIQPLEAAVTL